MPGDLVGELGVFDSTVRKVSGFRENEVFLYGNVKASDSSCPGGRLLSQLCKVPGGIIYPVNGQAHVFDTAEHVHQFLVHGVASNVAKWASGGVMSDFSTIFGEEAAVEMTARHGSDMIGIIPRLLVKKERSQLRAAHGIEMRDSGIDEAISFLHYDFWRPILLAKFSVQGPAR